MDLEESVGVAIPFRGKWYPKSEFLASFRAAAFPFRTEWRKKIGHERLQPPAFY